MGEDDYRRTISSSQVGKSLRDEEKFCFVSPSCSQTQILSCDQHKNYESKDDSITKEIANNPDLPNGGWGWVIVAASFLCNFVLDGIAYSFGIFLAEIASYYDVPKGKVAWVGSLLSGIYLSVGPLVSALTNRFGCRAVVMTGSIISCVAFLLSTQAPNVNVLMVTYGIIGGTGFGLIFLPAVVSTSHYFSTKRSLATGIAVCGTGVGAFAFAPLCQILLESYGWKGSMIIMAGLCLNCMVFGALMRPLETGKQKRPKLQQPVTQENRHRTESSCDSITIKQTDAAVEIQSMFALNLELVTPSTLYLEQLSKSPEDSIDFCLSQTSEVRKSTSSKKNKVDGKEEPEGLAPLSGNGNLNLANITHIIPEADDGQQTSTIAVPLASNCHVSSRCFSSHMESMDIFSADSVRNLPGVTEPQGDTSSYVISVMSVSKDNTVISQIMMCSRLLLQTFPSCLSLSKSITGSMSNILDFSLLKNKAFLLTCIANFIGMLGFYVPYVYITDSSIMKGISAETAPFLLSVIGITNTLGRLLFGWLADKPGVNALAVSSISTALTGVCILCIPFCNTYETIVADCALFGLFASACVCLTSVILVELLGLDNLTNAFGLLGLFRGTSCMVGAPFAGFLYDATGSYDIPFYVAGVLLVIYSALSLMAPLANKHCTKNRPTVQQAGCEENQDVIYVQESVV